MKKHRMWMILLFVLLLVISLQAQPIPVRPPHFNDELFFLYDNGDATKRLMFEVSGITTDTTRTWMVPDYDVVANAFIDWTNASDNFKTSGSVKANWIKAKDLGGTNYLMLSSNSNLTADKALYFDVGNGNRTLHIETAHVYLDQDCTSDAVWECAGLNTGHGDNQLYAMNQDVETTDDVVFNEVAASIVSSTKVGIDEASPKAELQIGGDAVISTPSSCLTVGYNAYWNGAWRRLKADNDVITGRWADDGDFHIVSQTDEGDTADSVITFAEIFAIDNTGNLTLSGTVDGIDIATDVAANTAKVTESTTVDEASPLTLSTYEISIPAADTGTDGYLSQTDWDTFNGKSDLALGETSTTAYRGDRGKTAYEHVSANGSSHTFIDQAVTMAASPTFADLALSTPSACRAYRSANQQITTGGWRKVELNAEAFDVKGEFDSTTNHRFIAADAGYYQVNVAARLFSVPAGTAFYISIWKNGGLYAEVEAIPGATAHFSLALSDIVYCNGSTDFVELYVYQNSGGSLTLQGHIATTYMSVHRLS